MCEVSFSFYFMSSTFVKQLYNIISIDITIVYQIPKTRKTQVKGYYLQE